MFYLTINKNPALYKFVQGSRGILSNYPGLIRYWILQTQKQLDLSSKQMEKLCPFKDDEEIVRIYGQIKETPLFNLNR